MVDNLLYLYWFLWLFFLLITKRSILKSPAMQFMHLSISTLVISVFASCILKLLLCIITIYYIPSWNVPLCLINFSWILFYLLLIYSLCLMLTISRYIFWYFYFYSISLCKVCLLQTANIWVLLLNPVWQSENLCFLIDMFSHFKFNVVVDLWILAYHFATCFLSICLICFSPFLFLLSYLLLC